MNLKSLFYILMLVGCLAFPVTAHADGIIIPEPPICDPGPCPPPPVPMTQLVIRYHRVTVTIEDQVAITRVDQVFYNPNDWQVEGTYMFPIPQDAVISAFSLWIDGEPVQGEVLDAGQARRQYEEIVRTLRDPALLEYAGSGAWQARIFPIPSQGERRVELEYTQALTADNGLVKYIYPLSTEKFSQVPLENVSVSVSIRSQEPIRAVYSPTHVVDISKESNNQVKVGYEVQDVLPDRDFGLYYSIGETQAFHLLTYRDPGDREDGDGFFMVLLAPRPEVPEEILPKDVILVLDRSGSMEGEKFQQAQEALRYILKNLNEGDRFNIITFSTGVETYASALRPADEANEALPWVDQLSARGNTDINRALLEAASLTDEERPTYLIFLTDGLPTEGVVESQQIIKNFQAEAPANLRLFAFGVGYDVDTVLLDSLSQENHGASAYVMPEERLDEQLSAFYEKISTPVLTDLALDLGEAGEYDVYPEPLPDLFLGSQIVVVGRYHSPGTASVTLTGEVNNETETFRFDEQVFSADNRSDSQVFAALPRLWATRKIGYLLNQIRLNGADEETINQIVRLSIRYGIVTPYTSYLVTEELTLGDDAQARIAEEQYAEMQAMPAAPVSGQDAVLKSSDQSAMAGAESPLAPNSEDASRVRIVGSRTFVFQNGLWTDTAFDPQRMQTIKVAFLSDDYFRLVAAYPELGPAFALGEGVIALADGTAYEVTGEDAPVQALPDLPTRPSEEQPPVPETTAIAQVNQPTPTRPQGETQEPASEPTPEPAQPSSNPVCASLLLPLGLLGIGALIVIRKNER
jgi:Ca-activated chloride channel homolog